MNIMLLLLNIFSGGTFKYEKIRRGNAQLTLRHDAKESDPRGYDTININYYPLFMNMLTQMNSVDSSPHIALGFPAAKAKKILGDRYKYVAPPDLNSFTYVGFNFKTKNRKSHQLIQNQSFDLYFHFPNLIMKGYYDLQRRLQINADHYFR